MSEELATEYAAARPRLLQVAYAILGSLAEAEDVVSECWPRHGGDSMAVGARVGCRA